MWKRWLFHATDFQSLMYPCFTFCRILGIFPYKLEASIFKASKPCYILSVMISYTYCVFTLILIHDLVSINYFGEITRNLQTISFYMLSIFIVIITHILSDARMRLLQTILEISKLPSESYQKLSRLIHIKDILAIIFQIIHIYIHISKMFKVESNSSVLCAVFTSYFVLLELQINMLYINCVCVLKACFKRINDTLAHMQIMINDRKECNLRLICHVQRNQFLLIELNTQKKQHLMVSSAVRMLNMIFSLQLLAIVIMTFLTTTFYLYFYAVQWQDGISISLNKHFLDIFLSSMAYNILRIILLVWACETCKNQAQEIVTTIHNLLNSIKDDKIKKELQLFSLQTLHCENTFSVKGLTLDVTLLATIVGTIATYLLILIQFLNMSHSCDGKAAISVIQSN